MAVLAKSITLGPTTYPEGTDSATMPASVVARIRNPEAWVGGVAPALPGGGERATINPSDLLSPERARLVLGVPANDDPRFVGGARQQKLDRNWAYRGVNLSGAEFGSWDNANVNPTHWRWPHEQEWQFLASRGHALIRVPYMWERLQPDLTKPNDAAQMTELDRQIEYARANGLKVIIDNHNYGMYKGVRFGANGGPTKAQFVAHWVEMSTRYKDDPTVIGYGLMNEPNNMPTADMGDGDGSLTGPQRWYKWSQACVDAIRANDDATAIMVAGYASSVMASWMSSNAAVTNKIPWITDPLNNFFYEAHHYWDNASGSYTGDYDTVLAANVAGGQSTAAAADGTVKTVLNALHNWIDWLERHNVRGFVGEFGWPRLVAPQDQADVDRWNELADRWLSRVDAAGARVWTTVWSTGSKWSTTVAGESGYNLNLYYDDPDNPEEIAEPAENAWPAEAHLTFRAAYEDQRKRNFSTVFAGQFWRGQSVDHAVCTAASSITAGQVYVAAVPIENAGALARISLYVGTAGSGATAGQCLAAIYDPDSWEQVATTGDFGTALNSTGFKNLDLAAATRAYRVGEFVYVALLWNGTTPPTLLKAPTLSGAVLARRFGLYAVGGVTQTGQTALPATLNPGSMNASPVPMWAAVAGW